MRQLPRRAPLTILLGILVVISSAQAELRLWSVDSLTRVSRNEPVGERKSISISAARNEWEPFQVVITGPYQEITECSLSVSPLIGPDRAQIDDIDLYYQHYVDVSSSSERAPLGPGRYPDALVPISQGIPFLKPVSPQLSGIVNQPIWIDVKIPDSATPGTYRTTVQVSHRGTTREIPVSLQVWNFQLPNRPTLQSCFGLDFDLIQDIYGFEKGTVPFLQIARKFETILADHYLAAERFWGSIDSNLTPPKLSLDSISLPLIGSPRDVTNYFLKEKTLTTISVPLWPDWPFADPIGTDREVAKQYVANYVAALDEEDLADYVIAHCGYVDEPATLEEYAEARTWGAFYNEVESEYGIRIPLLLTEQPQPEGQSFGTLQSSVDIWTVHVSDLWDDLHENGYQQLPARLQAGDRGWLYTSLVCLSEHWNRQNGSPEVLAGGQPPAWLLDYPPMNFRIWSWAAHLHDLTGVLYWATIDSAPGVDPWQDAGTFRIEEHVFNGDGFLIYPGLRELVGFDGPVASIRLKWLREAMEDHAYLKLLQESARSSQSKAITDSLIRNIGDWENAPQKLFAARTALAQELSKIP